MNPLIRELTDMKPGHEYFIGFDSDGCVFDSMDIKHKECFCPAFIDNYNLQGISNLARRVWEFVNLYSSARGLNRFLAAIQALDILRACDESKVRGIPVPSVSDLVIWTNSVSNLGQAALEEEVNRNHSPGLRQALTWSKDVSDSVKKIIRNLPPFPQVTEVLNHAYKKADLMVVSQTPGADLEREWSEYDIDQFVRIIAGQERGSKTEHLRFGAAGKYPDNHILVVGDAPGDLAAARDNGALFFPIIPGAESESWDKLRDEGLDRLFSNTYAGAFQDRLLKKFDRAVPDVDSWVE